MSDFLNQLELPAELKATAVPLTELGMREVAWSRANAVRVLDHLAGQPIAVLGGDVLEVRDGQIRYAYSNWHVEPESSESFSAFAVRSHDAARRYIARYPPGPPESLYVLVLQFGPGDQVT